MALSTPMRPLTVDDLARMPDDGNRYELLHGELLVTAAPDLNHERLTMALVALLLECVESRGLGEIFTAPVDVRFSRHTNVQPDLLFIREDRVELLDRGAEVVGAPDLVVEIISPSSRSTDRIRKAVAYADAGVPEYWLVDPTDRTVEVMKLDGGHFVAIPASADGTITSIVLPELDVNPKALFARLRP